MPHAPAVRPTDREEGPRFGICQVDWPGLAGLARGRGRGSAASAACLSLGRTRNAAAPRLGTHHPELGAGDDAS